MSITLGFSVKIYIPSGKPEGARLIQKSNWSGQGVAFPRTRLHEVRIREELKHTGVYVIYDSSEGSQLPSVYVGEGDGVLARIERHAKKKDFWTYAVAFTSKDKSLNKAHVQHLEARLYQLASEAKRCELENSNIPQKPTLTEAEEADAELFLADMLLCLPVLGADFFDKPEVPPSTDQFLLLKGKGIEARGFEGDGGFVVRGDSQAAKDESSTLSPSISRLREQLVKIRVLEDVGEAYRFSQDYAFSSPSCAASAVLGGPCNGRTKWKDAQGRTLKAIQNEATVGSEDPE